MMLILIVLFASTACTNTNPFVSEDIIDRIEAQLSDTCGDHCIDVFHELLPLVTKVNPNNTAGLAQQFSDFNLYIKKFMTEGYQENDRLVKELSNITATSFAGDQVSIQPHRPPTQPGVPCATQAECDGLDFKMNRCAHLRKGALTAYAGANTVLSVLANMITLTCGCIFAGPANVCVLRGVPYVCVFPYYAYSGIFGLHQSLWQAVVMMSRTCSLGGPSIA